jgi:hypothetical protein
MRGIRAEHSERSAERQARSDADGLAQLAG